MSDRQNVTLALGTNHCRERNMSIAKERLSALLSAVHFTRTVLTEPIDIGSRETFANAIAIGETELEYQDLRQRLKAIEREAGRTAESKAQGIIPLDIDILKYGTARYKPEDWLRPYNISLLKELQ